MTSAFKKLFKQSSLSEISPLSAKKSISLGPQVGRFVRAERDLGIPIRFVYLALVYNFLFFPVGDMPNTNEVLVEAFALAKNIFFIYLFMNILYLIMLGYMGKVPYRPMLYATFTMALLDGLMFCCLIFVEDGFSSSLYWVYFGMIMRNAYAISDAFFQIALNLSLILLYVIGCLFSESIFDYDKGNGSWLLAETVTNTEQITMRLVLLISMVFFCFAFQVLFDREKSLREEQLELRVRNEHLKGMGRLVAEIAHQLKNPLSIINNAAYLLERKQDDCTLVRAQACVIRQEIARSDMILKDLMSDADQSASSVKKVSIKEEIEKAADRVIPKETFPNIKLDCQFPDSDDLFLLVQPKHVSEIFINLLVNAREAIQGNGKITIALERQSDSDIVINISDDGQGIDPKIQTKVFESYFSTKEGGSGLGLGIVKKYLEFYSGTISLKSSESGTTFTLVFPQHLSTAGHY